MLLSLHFIQSRGQEPVFRIKFSEPLAVFEFVNALSANAENNPFKKLFDSSRFNQGKYKTFLAEYDSLNIDYSYEFTSYPYAQKIGGATRSLLKRNLLNSQTFVDFKLSSLGIIPNSDLFTLDSILMAFDPVYQELVYLPNKDRFEQQLGELRNLVASRDVMAYFGIGLRFYHSSWDNSIPFEMAFYPLPNSKGFTATAFYNNAESAIPTSLKDYNKLLSVMLHEIFHILYDEQSLIVKQNIQNWFTSDASVNSRYAYLLLNESLATALGNGYVYGKLNGGEDTSYWYRRKYTNLMAKKIYPLVSEYILQQKSIDKSFVENYIKIYDDNFSIWLTEIDNVMTDRYVISDKPADFEIIDELFPYRSMSQYESDVSESSIEKMKQAPITKVVIISKDNSDKVRLIKQNFTELKNWTPDVQADFSHSAFLGDKTFLIIVNVVRKTSKEQLEGLKESPLNPKKSYPADRPKKPGGGPNK